MPPLNANPYQEEAGPAARQRSFVEQRLAGATTEPQQVARSLNAAPTAESAADPTELNTSSSMAAVPDPIPTATVDASPNPAEMRRHQLTEFRTRQLEQNSFPGLVPSAAAGPLASASRGVEVADFVETNRWTMLGPSVVREGQSGKQPATSGRVRAIAVAPGGQRIYIASANGGVWRSEDGGHTWLSLMDAFDLNPSLYRADSLACGALALAPGNWAGQDLIFVGSGEPGVVPWFQGDSAYFGVGPIVSIDGGLNWITEESEPSLAGRAFYALAIDPHWPQRVVAATIDGLYRREPDAQGTFRWLQKQSGYFCSVVAAHHNGVTTFYAAAWYGGFWHSHDGESWTALGNGFPGSGASGGDNTQPTGSEVNVNVGRVGLAVQPDNPDLIYALVANSAGHLHGLYRMDRTETGTQGGAQTGEQWCPVRNVPPTLFGPDLQQPGQGGYDLTLAVDPDDPNRVYIGGSIVLSDGIQPALYPAQGGDWSGALYRCEIEVHPTRRTVQASATYIGGAIHGDLHALCFAPGNAQQLWVGCDGGVFFSSAPTDNPIDVAHFAGLFVSRNIGLSTLTMNYLAQHPTEEALIFCGTQDNGGLRYTGDPVWLYSSGGDSGYFVINWRDPYQVMTTFIYNQIYRSNNGGMRYSYDAVHVLPANNDTTEFYAPLAGTPYDPTEPGSADRVAFGGERVWLSEHFGGEGLWWNGTGWSGEVDWRSLPTNQLEDDRLDGNTEALVFASANRLYAGTTNGRVYRFDLSPTIGAGAGQWQRTTLPAIANDEVAALFGPITSIAIDPAVPTGTAIYITLGGMANPHRVWYFDGTRWEPRSGPQPRTAETTLGLLDVQHNALVVDPQQPAHLYVAADIGVWRSVDSGRSWQVFSRGLPDAAVVDIKLHAPSRLLRAATHGRGVYEFDLGRPQRAIDLYLRDHALDLGRRPAGNGLPDPTLPGALVYAGQSPDIKIDRMQDDGNYQSTAAVATEIVDLYRFTVQLSNEPIVLTHSRFNLQNHIYVQVHNRGLTTANNVRVMLLLATNKSITAEMTTAEQDGSAESLSQQLPLLPENYEQFVRTGLPIASEHWQTIGFATVHGIRAGYPQIAQFTLDADLLPTTAQLHANMTFSLVALLHCPDDPFVAERSTILTPGNNRQAAHKQISVIPFTGKVPAGTARRKRQDPGEGDWLAEHKVRTGETLSSIAKHYYQSARLWPAIYYANQRLIGSNPNYINRGWILKIPRQP